MRNRRNALSRNRTQFLYKWIQWHAGRQCRWREYKIHIYWIIDTKCNHFEAHLAKVNFNLVFISVRFSLFRSYTRADICMIDAFILLVRLCACAHQWYMLSVCFSCVNAINWGSRGSDNSNVANNPKLRRKRLKSHRTFHNKQMNIGISAVFSLTLSLSDFPHLFSPNSHSP